MNIRKILAGSLAAVMTGATLGVGAFAAADLKNYPQPFVDATGAVNALQIVAATASVADVVGALSIQESQQQKSLALKVAAASANAGKVATPKGAFSKDGITIGMTANPTSGNLGTGPNAFPSITAIKNAHYPGFWFGSWQFNSSTFYAHVEADVSRGNGIQMRHDLATSNINGSEKMVVGTNANIILRYMFDTAVPNVGTIALPQYSKSLKINFLGKDFSIVGVGTNSIKLLAGTVGTAVRDGNTPISAAGLAAPTGVTYGDYTVYVIAGANNDWSTLEIRDKTGAVVDTITNAKEGDTKTSTKASLDVKVTDIRVSGTDPATQHIEADVVVGPTGQAEVEYDNSAEVSTSSKERFPGEKDWYLTYSANSGAAGTIASGATINAEYRPTATQYLTADQGVSFPNNQGQLKFKGFNTPSWTDVKIKPVGPITAYNSTDNPMPGSTFYGLEMSSTDSAFDGVSLAAGDPTSSVASGSVASPSYVSAVYLLFNQSWTFGGGQYDEVVFGFKNSNGKVQINDTVTNFYVGGGGANNPFAQTSMASVTPICGGPGGAGLADCLSPRTTEYWYVLSNKSSRGIVATGNISTTHMLPFKASHHGSGDIFYWFNYTINESSTGAAGQPYINLTISSSNLATSNVVASGNTGSINVTINNRSAFLADTANLATDMFRLGATASSAEASEVMAHTENGLNNAGNLAQSVVTDTGAILVNTAGNGASDILEVLIPSKQTGVVVAIEPSALATHAPSRTPVAKLDTELTAADKAAHNVISVGGPCVNKVTAELMGKTFPACGADSGIPKDKGWLKLYENAFGAGKVALVVAGWEADDTRRASDILAEGPVTHTELTGTAAEV